MPDNLYELPADLPVPSDDGAADHLTGLKVPSLTLDSTQGGVDLAELAAQRLVLYLYPHRPPRTASPGRMGLDPGRTRLHPGIVRIP
jgi:hypothetical protein